MLKNLAHSFSAAGRGIYWLIAGERNARWHLLATVTVVLWGLISKISRQDWLAVILACGLVWSAEGMNSAVELLCNVVQPEHDARIGRIKDIAAGAVLLAALAAVGVGMVVFVK